ncbi:hypothetical protein N7568_22625, partial [Paenarthrobacter aurescens]|nr:hypothetical protein [Paenarthrobacter aurescens]
CNGQQYSPERKQAGEFGEHEEMSLAFYLIGFLPQMKRRAGNDRSDLRRIITFHYHKRGRRQKMPIGC